MKNYQRAGHPRTIDIKCGRWGLKVLQRPEGKEYRFIIHRRRGWFCWAAFSPAHLTTSRTFSLILPWFETYVEFRPGNKVTWRR